MQGLFKIKSRAQIAQTFLAYLVLSFRSLWSLGHPPTKQSRGSMAHAKEGSGTVFLVQKETCLALKWSVSRPVTARLRWSTSKELPTHKAWRGQTCGLHSLASPGQQVLLKKAEGAKHSCRRRHFTEKAEKLQRRPNTKSSLLDFSGLMIIPSLSGGWNPLVFGL